MRKLFQSALLSSVDSLLSKLGKFRCQLYSLKMTETPVKALILKDESLLTRAQVSTYLNLSVRYVRTLQARGILPFFWNSDHYCCKLSDLEKVKELNPDLFKHKETIKTGKSFPSTPFYSKTIKIAPFIPEWAIVDFRFDSWQSHFFVPFDKSSNEDFINSVCKSLILHQNEIKPFKLNPLSFFSKN